MNRMYKTGLLMAAVLSLAAMPMQAATSMLDFGIPATITAGGTTNIAAANCAVNCDSQTTCSLVFECDTSKATNNLGTIAFTFARMGDSTTSHIETSPKWTWTVVLPSARTAGLIFWTNVPAEVLGPASSFKVTSIVNGDGASGADGTNAHLYMVRKTIKAAP
jgi:hypothetical protein